MKCPQCGQKWNDDSEVSQTCGACYSRINSGLVNQRPEVEVNAHGAKRQPGVAGSKEARYDLLSPIALRRWAETFAEGAAKYGDHNYLRGFPVSVLMNHALAHLNQYMAGDTSEDHLAHAFWNIGAIIHFSETRPDLDDRHPLTHTHAPK